MKRKDFLKKGLKGSLGLSAMGAFLEACTKIESSFSNTNGVSESTVGNASAPFPWPVQNPTYRTLLPRHGVYGLGPYGGDGSHPDNPVKNATRVYFINTTASGSSGTYDPVTRVGYGTVAWCFAHTTAQANALGGPAQPNSKVIIPLVSGTIHLAKGIYPSEDYTEYWGQFAPHPGLWFRNTPPLSTKSFVAYWHLPSYVGDDAAGSVFNNRDAGATGDGDKVITTNVRINCTFAWSIDELYDAYWSTYANSCLYSMFIEPLQWNQHTDDETKAINEAHGFGPIVGNHKNSVADKIGFERCVFAHAMGRNPFFMGLRLAMAECLTYNWGRLPKGKTSGSAGTAAGLQFGAASGITKATVVSNGWIKGPQQSDAHNCISGYEDFSEMAGSQIYLANNAVHGYTIGKQGDLLNNAWSGVYTGAKNKHFPANFLSSGVLPDAIPIGWGNNLENIYKPWANPLAPTKTEWLNYIALMRSSCGPWPGRRTTAQGREEKVFNQMVAAINNDNANMGGAVNSVAGTADPVNWPNTKLVAPNAGGWGQLPTQVVTVNPANPGSHWVAKIMAAADGRDVPYTSGIFSNGLSRVGYSPLRVLAIEQHWYVGGK